MKKFSQKVIVIALIVINFSWISLSPYGTATDDQENVFVYGMKTYNRLDTFDPAGPNYGDYWEIYEPNCYWTLGRFNSSYYLETGGIDYYLQTANSYNISEDNRTIYVELRPDVKYHDGTEWNATTIKWNFDRFYYVVENVEDINYDWYFYEIEPTRPYYTENWNLSWVPDGERFRVHNACEVIDRWHIKYTTNFASLTVSALADQHLGGRFSPTYYADYKYDFIDDTVHYISNGPYKFDYHRPESFQARLEKFEDFYDPSLIGDADVIICAYYESKASLLNAFLAGEVDAIYEPLEIDAINASTISRLIGGTITGYMHETQFNCIFVNKTIREALVHCVDYDEALESILDNIGIAGGWTPGPNHIYYNDSIYRPIYNLTRARKVLIDAGIAQGLTLESSDEDWMAVADSDHPIAQNHVKHSVIWDDHADILIESARYIGIKIDNIVMEGGDIYAMVIDPDLRGNQLEIFHTDTNAANDALGLSERPGYRIFFESGTGLCWNNLSAENPVKAEELDALISKLAYCPDNELWAVHSRIQEIIAEEWLSIVWNHKKFYAGLSNKWKGFMGIGTRWFWNLKLTEWNQVEEPIPGFPLVSLGVVGAISLVGLIYMVNRKKNVEIGRAHV